MLKEKGVFMSWICNRVRDVKDQIDIIDSPVPLPVDLVEASDLPVEVVKKEFKPQLWYPDAAMKDSGITFKTQGNYRAGFPEGAVVHHTAGTGNLKSTAGWVKDTSMAFIIIDKEGNLGQFFPLNRYGAHAGVSRHPNFPGEDRLSRFLIGIEVISWGTLTKVSSNYYKSYTGRQVPRANVRIVPTKTDNMFAGSYEKWTKPQEETLTKFLLWMRKQGCGVFSLDNVLGHDEMAGFRGKNDPGGSLSMSMPEYREYLKNQYLKESNS
jgi:hypothetical protein